MSRGTPALPPGSAGCMKRLQQPVAAAGQPPSRILGRRGKTSFHIFAYAARTRAGEKNSISGGCRNSRRRWPTATRNLKFPPKQAEMGRSQDDELTLQDDELTLIGGQRADMGRNRPR